MIRSLLYTPDGQIRQAPDDSLIQAARTAPGSLLWLDLSEEPDLSSDAILRQHFHFHPLAIDDALRETHVPKLDDWADYLYLVVAGISRHRHDGEHVHVQELDVFLGPGYLVTIHAEPVPALEALWQACPADPRALSRSSSYLFYMLADNLVNHFIPILEEIDTRLEEIEDQVFARNDSLVLADLMDYKRSLLRIRHIIWPMREVFFKLSRIDYPSIPNEDAIYFRDLYDHLVRLQDMNESQRDLLGSTLDTYLSVVNNRMNEVMKTLTIITTLFMPLTFITGFFGMNYFAPNTPFPAWTSLTAFILTFVAMISVPVAMFIWMRRNAWF